MAFALNVEARQDDYIRGICSPGRNSLIPGRIQLDRTALLLHSHQKDILSMICQMLSSQYHLIFFCSVAQNVSIMIINLLLAILLDSTNFITPVWKEILDNEWRKVSTYSRYGVLCSSTDFKTPLDVFSSVKLIFSFSFLKITSEIWINIA